MAEVNQYEEALSVQERQFFEQSRIYPGDGIGPAFHPCTMTVMTCIANSHLALGHHDHALGLHRCLLPGWVAEYGEEHESLLLAACTLAGALITCGENSYHEARSLMQEKIPIAQRALGPDHIMTLRLRARYARTMFWNDDAAFRSERLEAKAVLEDVVLRARRVHGPEHPGTKRFEKDLETASEVV